MGLGIAARKYSFCGVRIKGARAKSNEAENSVLFGLNEVIVGAVWAKRVQLIVIVIVMGGWGIGEPIFWVRDNNNSKRGRNASEEAKNRFQTIWLIFSLSEKGVEVRKIQWMTEVTEVTEVTEARKTRGRVESDGCFGDCLGWSLRFKNFYPPNRVITCFVPIIETYYHHLVSRFILVNPIHL